MGVLGRSLKKVLLMGMIMVLLGGKELINSFNLFGQGKIGFWTILSNSAKAGVQNGFSSLWGILTQVPTNIAQKNIGTLFVDGFVAFLVFGLVTSVVWIMVDVISGEEHPSTLMVIGISIVVTLLLAGIAAGANVMSPGIWARGGSVVEQVVSNATVSL